MQLSPIEWTDYTANPLKYRDPDGNVVHACIHKSGGCLHCYAEALAGRWGRKGLPFTAENMKRLSPFLDPDELRRMLRHKPASGKKCFIGDMTDIFGEWVPDTLLNVLFSDVLEMRTDVQWQILTKRADRMQSYLAWRWGEGRIPMRNIWIGVSVEDQKTADERIPLLLQTPASIRFVSYEPALGPVDFRNFFSRRFLGLPDPLNGIDWLIAGGESGPAARAFYIGWIESVKNQCAFAKVPLFVKQMGSNAQERNDRIADVWYYADGSDMDTEAFDVDSYRFQGEPVRLRLKDRKGGDPAEWPEDLRVREFPR